MALVDRHQPELSVTADTRRPSSDASDPSRPWLDEAGDADRLAALAAAENFPVASRLLPRRQREHLLAVYGFARLVDDIGDESPGDRLAELDAAEAELDRAFLGQATLPVFVRLQPTLAACDLPRQPFADLIEANRQDQRVAAYATWDDLRAYCRLSADPVGRIVLGAFGLATPERVVWSDDVCTALQVVEHLQDVGEDAARGRVYLPADVLARHGCSPEDLHQATASPALRAVVADLGQRSHELLASAEPLVRTLHGRPRWAVAAFAAGGLAALDAIDRAGQDVLAQPVKPAATRVGRRWLEVLWASRRWRRSREERS